MSKEKMKGFFITLEGGEGAGKSTLLKALKEDFLDPKLSIITTREPGGTLLGEMLRDLLLSESQESVISPKTELLLFLAARSHHIQQVIKPALDAGNVVICDRYFDSTLAYQSARGLNLEKVKELCEFVSGDYLPDLTFYLDIDPVIGLARSRLIEKKNASQGELDRIENEKLDFHEQIRKIFLKLAQKEPNRIHVLDASRSFGEVLKDVEGILSKFFIISNKFY